MALIGDLLTRFLQPIFDAIKRALGPFGKIIDLITHFWSSLQSTWTKALNLTRLVQSEILAWKTFKEAIPYKYGVISVPAAIDKTQSLVDQVIDAWHAIVDLAKDFKTTFEEMGAEDPAAEAKAAVEELEAGGLKNLLSRFPKLAKGAEKLLGWLAILIQWFEMFQQFTDDFTTIVQATKAIREEVETGSTVFLSQKNPRKMVTLEDGTKMNLRVGNLH